MVLFFSPVLQKSCFLVSYAALRSHILRRLFVSVVWLSYRESLFAIVARLDGRNRCV